MNENIPIDRIRFYYRFQNYATQSIEEYLRPCGLNHLVEEVSCQILRGGTKFISRLIDTFQATSGFQGRLRYSVLTLNQTFEVGRQKNNVIDFTILYKFRGYLDGGDNPEDVIAGALVIHYRRVFNHLHQTCYYESKGLYIKRE